MTKARNNLTIIGSPNYLINVVITNAGGGGDCAIDLSSISNVVLSDVKLAIKYFENNNGSAYGVWFISNNFVLIENCIFQVEIYGSNNIEKTFVAVNNCNNFIIRNSAIITVDMSGFNTLWHGATHGAEPPYFDNCNFIGTSNNYMVGRANYNNCFGNYLFKNFVAPISERAAKSYLLGNEIETINNKLPKLTTTSTTANFNNYKYLGKNIFQIAPAFNEIKNICGNSLDDIPNNFSGTVLLYDGEYEWWGFAKNWNNVNFKMHGIGNPVLTGGHSLEGMFEYCSNSTFEIVNVDFKASGAGRYWVFGQNHNCCSTVIVYNCNGDFISTPETASGMVAAPNSTNCLGIMIGGSVLSQNGLNWSVYNSIHNNVDCYTNNYQLMTGTLRKNILTYP